MDRRKLTSADALTLARMPASLALLFLSPCGLPFGILYLFCGISDMLDGFIARRTQTQSDRGEKLDSIADLLFFAVCVWKLLPLLHLAGWLWVWIAGIAAVKTVGILRRKTKLPLHSILNKMTGLMLFLLPVTLPFIPIVYSASAVCVAASIAALSEVLES